MRSTKQVVYATSGRRHVVIGSFPNNHSSKVGNACSIWLEFPNLSAESTQG